MDGIIGIDVGGTFTDLLYLDPSTGQTTVHKVPTTVEDPSIGLVRGTLELCDLAGHAVSDVALLMHGTTTATNALLEHDGACTGLLTTAGFRDVLHIGRHQRPQNYSIMQDIPWQSRPLVQRRHRLTVQERIAADGSVMVSLDEDAVRAAAEVFQNAGVEAIAVAFLNSYRNPVHERRAAEIIRAVMPDVFLTTSFEVAPQFREFERFTTVAANAFVGPKVSDYLSGVDRALEAHGFDGKIHVMMSSGGVATLPAAKQNPVTLLLSGPAAGVLGGKWAGDRSGRGRLITFDMGGTSADIGISRETGVIEAPARDTWVAGYPVLTPMLDLLTVGAGGGSVAYVDAGGALRVGPRSAGARPGPASYGYGGNEATITDAQVVLGRLSPDDLLGGDMHLDVAAAKDVVGEVARKLDLSLEETAEGIVRVANNNMASAVRSRTIERGLDPRDYVLTAFGGAGPLHAAELAEMLGIPTVLIPPYPGITSAMGLLTTDLRYVRVSTLFMRTADADVSVIQELIEDHRATLRHQLIEDGVAEDSISVSHSFDCRCVGQGYELRVPFTHVEVDQAVLQHLAGEFHAIHHQEYGHSFPQDPVEMVNLRTTVIGSSHKISAIEVPSGASLDHARTNTGKGIFRSAAGLDLHDIDHFDRWKLPHGVEFAGPAIVHQRDTTVLVPPTWKGRAEPSGALILEKSE